MKKEKIDASLKTFDRKNGDISDDCDLENGVF